MTFSPMSISSFTVWPNSCFAPSKSSAQVFRTISFSWEGSPCGYKVDKTVVGIILVNSKDLYPVILEQTGAYIANLKEDAIFFDGWLILQLLQLGRIQIFEASMIIAMVVCICARCIDLLILSAKVNTLVIKSVVSTMAQMIVKLRARLALRLFWLK